MALTREQYNDCLNSQVTAAMNLFKGGVNPMDVIKVLGDIPSLCWDLTRPDTEYHVTDIHDELPEALKASVPRLELVVVIDGKGDPIVGFGRGKGRDGNDITSAIYHQLGDYIDEQMKKHWGHLDMSGVVHVDKLFAGEVKKSVDKEVEEFRNELDDLFETWGGGES